MRGVAGFHPLTADEAGRFAVALDGPYRLVFEPDHDPAPEQPAGGIDEAAVTKVRILKVVDYHG